MPSGETMGSVISALVGAYGQRESMKQSKEMQDDLFDFIMEQQQSPQELFTGSEFAQQLIEGIMGRGGEGAILDWLFQPPVKMTAGEKREYGLFQEGEPMMAEIRGMLEGLRPTAQNLVDTGFRTDIQPIVDAELRRLNTQTAPALAERFSGSLSGSGFEQALAKASGDVSTFLGERQAGLDEAAANRRITGLNMAPGIFTNPLNLQTGFAEALGAAGERFRLRKEATRPTNIGAKLMQALTGLSGIEQGQGFMLPGFPGQTGAGANYAGLGSALGGLMSGGGQLMNALQGLFGGGSGSNYGSLFNTGSGIAGIDYNAGGIAGTGITGSEFDAIYGNGGAFSGGGSTDISGLTGGFSYVA